MTRLLVLGGSWFLGRAIVDHAQIMGCRVTTFRRGQSGEDLPGVETIRGDRTNSEDLSRLAQAGPWDAVIDTSGYVPRDVLNACKILQPVSGRYVFISSVSAYEGWPIEPLTEDSPVLECPSDADANYGYDGNPGPSIYGFTKAGSERAVIEQYGTDRSAILRPGVILGPYEYVGRLPWWLNRLRRGGRVLAPGNEGRSIQPVDVRDVAKFALHTATGPSGIFNVTASGKETMGDFLRACKEVTHSRAEFTWITDEQWLIEQNVAQWTELPLWRTYAGAWAVNSTRAREAGLITRPLAHTVADTWRWLNFKRANVDHERASEQGISPEKEAAILGVWDAREADRCGA